MTPGSSPKCLSGFLRFTQSICVRATRSPLCKGPQHEWQKAVEEDLSRKFLATSGLITPIIQQVKTRPRAKCHTWFCTFTHEWTGSGFPPPLPPMAASDTSPDQRHDCKYRLEDRDLAATATRGCAWTQAPAGFEACWHGPTGSSTVPVQSVASQNRMHRPHTQSLSLSRSSMPVFVQLLERRGDSC